MASKVSATVDYGIHNGSVRYHFEQTTNERGTFIIIWDRRGTLGLWKIERYNDGQFGRDWVRQIVDSELGGKIVKW